MSLYFASWLLRSSCPCTAPYNSILDVLCKRNVGRISDTHVYLLGCQSVLHCSTLFHVAIYLSVYSLGFYLGRYGR